MPTAIKIIDGECSDVNISYDLLYEIKKSPLTRDDIKDKEKYKRQENTLKKLNVGEMFIVDRKGKCASTWVGRLGKKLNRKFIVRRFTDKLTEIHRVE